MRCAYLWLFFVKSHHSSKFMWPLLLSANQIILLKCIDWRVWHSKTKTKQTLMNNVIWQKSIFTLTLSHTLFWGGTGGGQTPPWRLVLGSGPPHGKKKLSPLWELKKTDCTPPKISKLSPPWDPPSIRIIYLNFFLFIVPKWPQKAWLRCLKHRLSLNQLNLCLRDLN